MSESGAPSIRPRLKANVDVFRHIYRGDVWYVFHDRARDAFYRVSSAGAEIIGALDGKRGFDHVYQDFQSRRADTAPDPQTVSRFVGQINALGLLQTGAAPRTEQLDSRLADARRRGFWSSLRSPLAVRIPLFDPTPMLDRLGRLSAFLLGPVGIALWLAVVLIALGVAVPRWHELTDSLVDRMLSLQNLAVAWCVYPVVKVIHESMHAIVLRHYGGEVRRMGIIVVAFTPVPYVDASSSSTFSNKHWRMMVGAAGVMAEMFLGAVALLLWAAAEPGLFRTVCYNVVLITGLSTLIFNGNPLQRYDGYYVFSDLIEIPDLGTRAQQYLSYLGKRLLLADHEARPPRATPAERRWFLAYGPASFVYRTTIVVSIVWYVAKTYPVIGVVLSLWALAGVLWTPATALLRLTKAPDQIYRRRAWRRLGLIAGTIGTLLFVVPVPYAAVVDGFVWLPEEANARSTTAGEFKAVLATPGDWVQPGQPIAELVNPEILAKVTKAEAHLRELEAAYTQAFALDRVQAAIQQDKIAQARQELAEAERDRRGLTVLSPAQGKIVFPFVDDLPGKFFAKGEAVAVVWNHKAAIVRALVPLWQIDMVRQLTRSVQVRPTYDAQQRLEGEILRIVPSATDRLPSPVMATDNGGPIAAAREGPDKLRMSEPMFEVDVRLRQPMPVDFLSGRAFVRFDFGWQPIGLQLVRSLRLVFLRHFHA